MEKRRLQRSKKRLTCEVQVDGKSHAGIVRDHSASGIFVQTRVRPEPNKVVEVVFRAEPSGEEIRVEAGVVRERVSPSGLQSSVPGGVGLELLDPPPELFALLEANRIAGEGAPEQGDSDAPQVRTFRVRVMERDRPNSRVITVRCDSAQAARARALRQAGRGWKVTGVQEL